MTQGTARQRQFARWSWAIVDMACWAVAVYVAMWLRVDFDLLRTMGPGTLQFALAVAVFHLAVGTVIGPYAVGHARGSFEEVVDIGRAVLVASRPRSRGARRRGCYTPNIRIVSLSSL